MFKEKFGDLEKLTHDLFTSTHTNCDYKPWFSLLSRDSVFVCSGVPTLVGDVAIRSHFKNIPKEKQIISHITQSTLYLSTKCAQVYGYMITKGMNSAGYATTHFSMTYKLTGNTIKLVFQHMYFEYHDKMLENKLDIHSIEFVKSVRANISGKRIPIESGTQTLLVDINTILYIDARKNKCELICLDRHILCNSSITKIQEFLNENFYLVRRGTIINLRYLTAFRYCEAELISGIKIPIPEKKYKTVKEDFRNILKN